MMIGVSPSTARRVISSPSTPATSNQGQSAPVLLAIGTQRGCAIMPHNMMPARQIEADHLADAAFVFDYKNRVRSPDSTQE
jgi:hypothetical protein